MDACEAPRHEQAQPCPWPYTVASNCTETYAESVGRPYDVASLAGLVVDAVLLVILSRRALHALLDTEVLGGRRVRWCCGFARRTRSSLTSFDKAYLLMSFMLLVQCVLRLDLHGWRGVYNIRAYRTAQTLTMSAGYTCGVIIVDHYVTVSYMMAADVISPDLAAIAQRSFGHRMMNAFVAINVLLAIAILPALYTMEEGVEDAWVEAPIYWAANLILVICMAYAVRSVYAILYYLRLANEMEAHAQYVASARLERRERSISRTKNTLAYGTICALFVLVYSSSTAKSDFSSRQRSLQTPCGLSSLVFVPNIILAVMCFMSICVGPSRSMYAKRRKREWVTLRSSENHRTGSHLDSAVRPMSRSTPRPSRQVPRSCSPALVAPMPRTASATISDTDTGSRSQTRAPSRTAEGSAPDGLEEDEGEKAQEPVSRSRTRISAFQPEDDAPGEEETEGRERSRRSTHTAEVRIFLPIDDGQHGRRAGSAQVHLPPIRAVPEERSMSGLKLIHI